MANPRWPNVEKLVVGWVATRTGRPVFTETDDSITGSLPAYQVTRVGGAGGPDFTKTVQVEIDAIAATRSALWDAVADLETAMFSLAANGTEDWYVDSVTETFSAAIQPHENPGARRATATYGLALRPQQ